MAQTDSLAPRKRVNFQHMNELGLVAVIVLLYIVFAFAARNFLSFNNQVSILRDAASFGIAAWAVTLIIIAGEIDISTGPLVALLSVTFAFMLKSQQIPFALCFVLVIALGAVIGACVGALRAWFLVPTFIGTLALWRVSGGLASYFTDTVPVSIPPSDFMDLLGGEIMGIPTPGIIMLALFALFAFISRNTAFGRAVYAIGGNANAAYLSGISVKNVRVWLFVISGALAAVTAILLTARNGVGDYSVARSGLEFSVISAVVVGGTSLSGGRGSMLGTLLGIYVISVLGNGLVLMGINSYLQEVVSGAIILVAVLLNIQAIAHNQRLNLKARR
jgi:sugar transport system permease protein